MDRGCPVWLTILLPALALWLIDAPFGGFPVVFTVAVALAAIGLPATSVTFAPGETTKDGKFTVEFVECLAGCGAAPVMMCNEAFHEGVSEEKADEIIGGCK